jgi:propionyl-CoA carboxylase alpha chain
MIAKVIAHAPTRDGALEALADALDGFHVEGPRHNGPFLAALITHPRFVAGRLSTGFIAEEFPEGFTGAALDEDRCERLAAVAAYLAAVSEDRTPAPKVLRAVVSAGGRDYPVACTSTDASARQFDIEIVNGTREAPRTLSVANSWAPGEPVYHGLVNGVPMNVQVKRIAGGFLLTHRGATLEAFVRSPRAAELAKLMPKKRAPDTSKYLLSPMPGLVVSIEVREGQEVKAGETLAIVEAMKMENVLKAERDGIVKKVAAKKGDTLGVDQIILEFK